MPKPIPPPQRVRLQELAPLFGQLVRGWWKERLPAGAEVGFSAIVAANEPEPFCTYVSNLSRPEHAKLLRETASQLQAPAGAELQRPGRELPPRGPVRNALLTDLTKQLIDDGKIIEAGWVGMKLACVSDNAPQLQIDEMRMAFFAGAHHLFQSIVAALDADEEPTDDLRRMDQIKAELDGYARGFAEKHGIPWP